MQIDWKAAEKELAKPLNPDAVKPPPKGKFGEYVDGLHVISEANRIFGRNGWSYTVTRLECASNQIVELKGQNGPYTQARVAYVCAVRVDVGGVIREGLACGTGNGKPENIGDVIESAVKEAETDALKRALRTFGNTFGLALYEKDKSKREVGYEVPEVTDEDIKELIAFLADAESIDELRAKFANLPPHVKADERAIKAGKGMAEALNSKPTDPAAQDEIPYEGK
jgi:recombination DNA repair RAD52 pathway protein